MKRPSWWASGELMMRGNEREQWIMEQIENIVKNAPPEQDKREGHVIEQCLWLENAGYDQSACRRIDEEARKRLNLPQWGD